MNNQKIKSYDELNSDEHYVLDMVLSMKIERDKAQFQLLNYELNDLLNNYQQLQQLRKEIQAKYFAILEKIDASEFATVDVSYEKWSEVRDYENTNWNEEVEVMSEFQYYLNELIMQLNDGTMERLIIEEQKNSDVDC